MRTGMSALRLKSFSLKIEKILYNLLRRIFNASITMPRKYAETFLLLAFFFSLIVGLFFGLYPANKASRLNPIEALRYE